MQKGLSLALLLVMSIAMACLTSASSYVDDVSLVSVGDMVDAEDHEADLDYLDLEEEDYDYDFKVAKKTAEKTAKPAKNASTKAVKKSAAKKSVKKSSPKKKAASKKVTKKGKKAASKKVAKKGKKASKKSKKAAKKAVKKAAKKSSKKVAKKTSSGASSDEEEDDYKPSKAELAQMKANRKLKRELRKLKKNKNPAGLADDTKLDAMENHIKNLGNIIRQLRRRVNRQKRSRGGPTGRLGRVPENQLVNGYDPVQDYSQHYENIVDPAHREVDETTDLHVQDLHATAKSISDLNREMLLEDAST